MFYIFLADGFEECEALVPLDLLRRAGVRAVTVGVTGRTVRGSHGIEVTADLTPEQMDLTACRGVMLPGGMPGTKNLGASEAVKNALFFARDNGLVIAAICAAPSVLGACGLLEGKQAVCFPGFEEALTGAKIPDRSVVRDGNLITAKGAGCVFPFACEIIGLLCSPEAAADVLREIRYTDM